MSIDRDVNSVVEAYRGNDYALQEKYAVDKQLIDLLALQKLKSDREAAAKKIQMEAQVDPVTVAGQLENENLEAIKQQIVGGMPQEGILAAAQGGMVRGFAEGGTVRQKIINDYGFDPYDVAEEEGVDPELLMKVIEAESSGKQDSVSEADAVGLMQLMPGTARELNVDPTNPLENVRGGARYLKQQLSEFGDIPTALAAYNAGPTLVRNQGIPDYKETRDYINRILGENRAVATNEAEQNLPFDETVEVDLNEAKQTLPFDETVEVDPDNIEKLLDSSSEDEKIQEEIDREVQRKARGPIVRGGYLPNRVPEGSPAYRKIEKEVSEEVFGEAVDDILKEKLNPNTVQSDEDYNKALALKVLRDKGQIPVEELYEVVKSGQLPEVETKPEVATDTGTSGATTEPPMSAYDKIMEKYGASYKEQIDSLNKEDRIKRREDRLARLAEINKPEERSLLDMASDFIAGASASGIGGGGNALRQGELARRKRSKEYQTMLLENEEQIDNLAQTLGDQEMAINLTAATSEYARDVAATALKIDNEKDRIDFILKAMELMAKNVDQTVGSNLVVNARLDRGDVAAASKVGADVRKILMESPHYQTLQRMLAEMGVSLTGSPSGASSSGVSADTKRKYM
jgi:soluble lytic murein transglycosylase-like protein